MSADVLHALVGVSQGMDLIDMAFAHVSLDQQLTVVTGNAHLTQMAQLYHLPQNELFSWLKGSHYQNTEELLKHLSKDAAITAESRGHAPDGKSFHF